MAAVTIHSDFGAQENKVCHCFHFFVPSICHEVMGPDLLFLDNLDTDNDNNGNLLKCRTSQVALVVKNLSANAGDIKDMGSIPGLGRSSGGRHGNLHQYSHLENTMDREAWRVTVHRVFRGAQGEYLQIK